MNLSEKIKGKALTKLALAFGVNESLCEDSMLMDVCSVMLNMGVDTPRW